MKVARLTRDLPRFLRNRVSPDVAVQRVRRRLATREARFLRMVELGIHGNPRSPYTWLFRQAGCEPGDLRALVGAEGLEGALTQLAGRGVYLDFDEQKGRRAVVRGSQVLTFQATDLDSPISPQHFSVPTSGTGGTPSMIPRTLSQIGEKAEGIGVVLDAHGLRNPRHVIWLTGPVDKLLCYARLGIECAAWFHPLPSLPWDVRVGARYLQALGRAGGYQFPAPVFLDLQQPAQLIDCLAREASPSRPILLTATVSSAVRTATQAVAQGVPLRNVTVYAQGEPMTETRRQAIEAAGARVIVNYGSMELNGVGYGCTHPTAADDVHVFDDRWAVITRNRSVFEGGPQVDSLLFSSISPRSPRICLNVEMGDYAQVDRRDCPCRLGQLGLRTHLSEIRSFEKLTGEGMTVVGTNLLPLLEHVLPSRFGGNSLEYQLAEQERPDGTTELVLRVHPAVGAIDDEAVRAALLAGLTQDGEMGTFMADTWRRAGTVTVSREPPLMTSGGKILPLHLLRSAAGPRAVPPPGS